MCHRGHQLITKGVIGRITISFPSKGRDELGSLEIWSFETKVEIV